VHRQFILTERLLLFTVNMCSVSKGTLLMNFNKIVFCGAPLAGKTALLRAIAQVTNSDRIRTRFGEAENVTKLEVSVNNRELICVTISGVFYRHKQTGVLTELIKQADMIVYVCSTIPPKNAEPFYFNLYSNEAAHLHVSWNEIPWMFVLNKVDLSSENPLIGFIPPQFHNQIMKCAANQGRNVPDLWQKIVSTIS